MSVETVDFGRYRGSFARAYGRAYGQRIDPRQPGSDAAFVAGHQALRT